MFTTTQSTGARSKIFQSPQRTGCTKRSVRIGMIQSPKDGGTITGGTDHGLLYMTDGRLLAGLNIVLEKGASIAVKIDLNTSGGANLYAALIGYVKNPKND